MRLFHVFPVLFPDCSHSCVNGMLVFPVFRISGGDLYKRDSFAFAICSAGENIGNDGNMIETARVGLVARAEQTRNTGKGLEL